MDKFRINEQLSGPVLMKVLSSKSKKRKKKYGTRKQAHRFKGKRRLGPNFRASNTKR